MSSTSTSGLWFGVSTLSWAGSGTQVDGGTKKMFKDEEMIECALGDKEFCFWQGKKFGNVVFLFLTSRFTALICL